ncbi:MAG: homocysteine S-methyltransferase family protein [Solirubrobacterales bacterium]|nr:homocysteine S-methyltransferase family protein [Solirubrobacterales bacterium]
MNPHAVAPTPPVTTTRYQRLLEMIAARRCVILDGAIGTELIKVTGRQPADHEHLWGLTALVDSPAEVERVHRGYIDVGCDVVCTNTWGLPTALRDGAARLSDRAGGPVHWMDVARQAVRLARHAAADAGRGSEVAIAFSLNGDMDAPEAPETIRLLARAFQSAPPDLILVETLSLVRESTYETVRALLATGLPVWLSFRRCRRGVCGVYGEHWGGPEGDAFGRAAHRFEEMGVGALALNCIPPDHVPGMLSWLRDFTDLPLGVYPNLGYLSAGGWLQEPGVAGDEYAELALRWRAEGAQIIGGCCGVRPEHLRAARVALAHTHPGHERPLAVAEESGDAAASLAPPEWQDAAGRQMFPLPMPELVVDPGVFVPTQGSFLIWKYLFREGLGAGRRCLDIGCGTGLLTAALALNGAEHVHAIDIDEAAVRNTLTNAYRNGVADRVTAAAEDLYPWIPEERYDLVVASLYQTPVDPTEQISTHRPLDYWGRNLVDHLIGLLPRLLADDGAAYVMQLSIIGQRRTTELLARLGYRTRVVDFSFFAFSELFTSKKDQIARVEASSDAYHLTFGTTDVMVAYLLEITRERKESPHS